MDHLLHLSRHNTRDGARSQIRRGHPGAERSHPLAIPTPVQPLGSNSFNSLNGSGMNDTTCVVSNNISSRNSTIRTPRHGQSIPHCSTWGWRAVPESTQCCRSIPFKGSKAGIQVELSLGAPTHGQQVGRSCRWRVDPAATAMGESPVVGQEI